MRCWAVAIVAVLLAAAPRQAAAQGSTLVVRVMDAEAGRPVVGASVALGAPDPGGIYTYANVLRGWTRGVELDGGLQAGLWRFDGGAELLRTRDAMSRTPLLGRPGYVLRLSGTGLLPGAVRAGLGGTLTGPTPLARDAVGTITRERGSFFRVDTRLARRFASGITVSGGITNLLDRRLHDDWPGFTGRQAFVQLRWSHSPEH